MARMRTVALSASGGERDAEVTAQSRRWWCRLSEVR